MKEGVIEEYRTLRAEILQNDALMQRMAMFGFWAILAPLVLVPLYPQLAVFALLSPIAFLFYQQLFTHKLEGTIRIATYVAVFLEPEIDGAGWEQRIRQVKIGLKGVASHKVMLATAFLGSAFEILAFWPKDSQGLGLILLLAGFVLASVQLKALRKLSGPEGYLAEWRRLKGQNG